MSSGAALVGILVLAFGAGCADSYLVKRSDLALVDRAAAIPARREDGSAVFLRTATIKGYARSEGKPWDCFHEADTLQRSGQFQRAARTLNVCRALTIDDARARLHRHLDTAISADERNQDDEAIQKMDEAQAELDRAIAALESGDGAAVSIGALRVAAPFFAKSAELVQVRPRNRVRTAAKVLAGVGGATMAAGIFTALGELGCNRQCSEVPALLIAGLSVFGFGASTLAVAGIVALAGRHAAEANASLTLVKLDDPRTLALRRAKARRGALGSGVATGLSLALVATGAVLIDDAIRNCTGYCPQGNFAPAGRAGYGEGVAGIVLVAVGALGFNVSLPVMGSKIAVSRSLDRALAGAPSTPSAMPTVWFTRDGGGLALTGSF